MTDSLIFITQRKDRDIVQTRKYNTHCSCIKDGWQNATIVISLWNFDSTSLFLGYFRVPFDWNNICMSIYMYVMTFFFFLFMKTMMTYQPNWMLMTALVKYKTISIVWPQFFKTPPKWGFLSCQNDTLNDFSVFSLKICPLNKDLCKNLTQNLMGFWKITSDANLSLFQREAPIF